MLHAKQPGLSPPDQDPVMASPISRPEPIESLWNMMKRKMNGHKPTNKAELLESALQNFAALYKQRVTQQQYERLVQSKPRRMKAMPRDETVCKYCGISYLILHEFKNLEDKIKAMEKEMKFYQGSVEREKMLQDELKRLNQQYEQSRTDSESKAERLQVVMLQLKLKEDEVQQLTKERTYFQQQVKVAKHEQHMLGCIILHLQ
ncbi:protein LEKR1 [Bombina bombina]|uniref:protein LEKR1 n=1 Tax=Bombina bombina TaxID=8345 RepID=UPI00235AA89D|nr:protein LEKR1 [Bombina bombina]